MRKETIVCEEQTQLKPLPETCPECGEPTTRLRRYSPGTTAYEYLDNVRRGGEDSEYPYAVDFSDEMPVFEPTGDNPYIYGCAYCDYIFVDVTSDFFEFWGPDWVNERELGSLWLTQDAGGKQFVTLWAARPFGEDNKGRWVGVKRIMGWLPSAYLVMDWGVPIQPGQCIRFREVVDREG